MELTLEDSLTVERWLPIADLEFSDFYEVSSLGRVRSRVRRKASWPGRILRPLRHNHGYVTVMLHGRTRSEKILIHRLVATAFLGEPRGRHVNHKDGDKTHNAETNLEWLTSVENNRHAYRTGLSQAPPPRRGVEAAAAKLSWDQVREIRALAGTMGQRRIAIRFGVAKSTVAAIIHGESWAVA